MADNTVLSTNVGTGDTIRTLDDGSVKWPVGVCAYATTVGTPDVLQIVTAAAGLPVQQQTGASFTVANSGTFAVQVDGSALTALQLIDNLVLAEDAAHSTGDPGVQILAVRTDTPANRSGTDGDYEPLQVSAGRLWVDASGKTLTVASHDVTNAGTFAVQAAQSGTWNVGTVTAVTSITNTVTVDTELPAAAALADNASNPTAPAVGAFGMVWDGSAWDRMAGTSADGVTVNLGSNNDVTVTGSVTANAGTNLNTSALALESGGNLAAAATSLAVLDDWDSSDACKVVGPAAHDAAASGNPVMIGAEFDDTTPDSVDEGDVGRLRISSRRELYVQIRDAAGNERGLNVDASGNIGVTDAGSTLSVDDGAGSLTVDNATLSVTGGGVEASALRVTLASDSTGVLSVDDNGSSLTVDNGGTFAVQTGAERAEDAAHSSGHTGLFVLAVRSDTAAQTAGTDGDYCALVCDSSGRLHVNVGNTVTVGSHAVTNAGTFAVQVDGSALTALQLIDDTVFADDAAFAPGTSKVLAIGCQADESSIDSVDEGDVGCPRMTLDRKIHVSAELESNSIRSAGTSCTPKFAVIDAATSGDNTLVSAVASKKIRVLALFMVAAGAVNARFESGAGGTALTGQMNLTTNSGFVLPFNPLGWFETASNTLLNLELSGAVSVDGSLVYAEVT